MSRVLLCSLPTQLVARVEAQCTEPRMLPRRCAPKPTGGLRIVFAWVSSGRSCVVSKNVVVIFGRQVAGEAGLVQRFIAGFAVHEVGVSPAAGRGVLLRVLDHELNVHSGPGKGRFEAGAGKTA